MDQHAELQKHGIQQTGEIQPVGSVMPQEVAPHVELGEVDYAPQVEGINIQVTGSATPHTSQHEQEVQITQQGSPQSTRHESIISRILDEAKLAFNFLTPLERGANDSATYKPVHLKAQGIVPDEPKVEVPSSNQPPIAPTVADQTQLNPSTNSVEHSPTVPSITSPVIPQAQGEQNPAQYEPTSAPFADQATNPPSNVVPLTSTSPAPASEQGVTAQPVAQDAAA